MSVVQEHLDDLKRVQHLVQAQINQRITQDEDRWLRSPEVAPIWREELKRQYDLLTFQRRNLPKPPPHASTRILAEIKRKTQEWNDLNGNAIERLMELLQESKLLLHAYNLQRDRCNAEAKVKEAWRREARLMSASIMGSLLASGCAFNEASERAIEGAEVLLEAWGQREKFLEEQT